MQYLIAGIVTGMAYSLVSIGIVIIYSTIRAFQFAQGALVMFGAYLFLRLYDGTHNLVLSVLGLVAVITVLSLVISIAAFEPLIGKHFPSLIVGLGLALVLSEVVPLYFFSGQAIAYPAELKPSGSFTVLGAQVTTVEVLVFVVALAAVAVLDRFFHASSYGRQMRALADSWVGANLVGIRTKRVVRLAFVIAGLASCCAAILLGILLSQVTPSFGDNMTFKSMAAVLVAGSTSFRGAVLASVMIGVAESLVTGYASPTWSSAIAYVVVVVVLLVRPNGLFAAPVESEAAR
jgi:branched-chain amino acid transport system permease protein